MYWGFTGYLRGTTISYNIKYQEVEAMIFEDNQGKMLMPEEVNELSVWEIEDRGIHVLNDMEI
jgi:hypothetical protein